jgi:hypothetical protein
MFSLQRLFADFLHIGRSVRLVALFLCLTAVMVPALAHTNYSSANASRPASVLAQSSPLSPLAEPAQTNLASAEAENATAPELNQGDQTSLVLVAFVLVGVLVVIGLVMWRQR